MPLELRPPKIMARVGTAIIDTPATPTFDIPMSKPTNKNKQSCSLVNSNENNAINFKILKLNSLFKVKS